MNIEDLYKENILELYKKPHNFKVLEKTSHEQKGHNPNCGDNIIIQLYLENGYIKDIGFQGSGCAISMAGVSLLTECAKNLNIREDSEINEEKVLDLLGIPISQGRMRCAMLGLNTLGVMLKKV